MKNIIIVAALGIGIIIGASIGTIMQVRHGKKIFIEKCEKYVSYLLTKKDTPTCMNGMLMTSYLQRVYKLVDDNGKIKECDEKKSK